MRLPFAVLALVFAPNCFCQDLTYLFSVRHCCRFRWIVKWLLHRELCVLLLQTSLHILRQQLSPNSASHLLLCGTIGYCCCIILPLHLASNIYFDVPRSMMNDTYSLPSPIEPRSSIHAQRRRRRRRRRRIRRHVVWS